MTTVRCPSCSGPLAGTPSCPSCGLRLVGPVAARLWQVDQELLSLDGSRALLLAERTTLLGQLRPDAGPTPVRAPAVEARPASVQTTLLGLGALLLAVAGVVFAAVTYRALGVVGRAGVLLALTGAAAWAPVALRRRGLTSSAEAVSCVALVLAVVDVWSLRRAGLATGLDARTYWAGAAALLSATTALYGATVPLRSARTAAVLLGQAPVVLVLVRTHATPSVAAVVLAGLGALDLLLAHRRWVAPAARGCGVGALVLATGIAAAVLEGGDGAGAVGLVSVAAVLAAASVPVADRLVRGLLSGLAVLLVGGAAYGLVRPAWSEATPPFALVAVGLVALQVAGLLARDRRGGPVAGALLVCTLAVLREAEPVLQAVAAPFGWAGSAWTLVAGSARAAVGPGVTWSGTAVTLAVLLGAGAAALAAGAALDRVRGAVPPAGLLLVLAGLVLPLAVDTSYRGAVALLVVEAAVLTSAGLWWRTELLAAAVAPVALAVAWSLASRDVTLAVLPVAAALAAAASVRVPWAATPAALLLGGEVAAVGAARGLSADQVGATLVLAAAGALAVALRVCRLPLEAAAGALAAAGVLLAVGDPGWLSWTLVASGLLALALALRPERRVVAVAGALLLSASSWVRLADAHVTAPEPYVLPLAVVALGLGHLRRRQQPGTSSFAAYGPGLSLLLLPSLLASLTDDVPLRGVLLLPAAALVVLAGVQERLRAPLTIGGVVLVVDALRLLAPYASALPRWSLLALVGAVLVVLGATYEQRRRDLASLRERYAALV